MSVDTLAEELFGELSEIAEGDFSVDEKEEQEYREALEQYRGLQRVEADTRAKKNALSEICKNFHRKYKRERIIDVDLGVQALYYKRKVEVIREEPLREALEQRGLGVQDVSRFTDFNVLWEKLGQKQRRQILEILRESLPTEDVNAFMTVSKSLLENVLDTEAKHRVFATVEGDEVFSVRKLK